MAENDKKILNKAFENTLEEVMQYRAIGTIEEFKALKEKEERFDRNIKMFNEIGLEIRNKAIDEFVKRIEEHSFVEKTETEYSNSVSFMREIKKIAEQMKGGAE